MDEWNNPQFPTEETVEEETAEEAVEEIVEEETAAEEPEEIAEELPEDGFVVEPLDAEAAVELQPKKKKHTGGWIALAVVLLAAAVAALIFFRGTSLWVLNLRGITPAGVPELKDGTVYSVDEMNDDLWNAVVATNGKRGVFGTTVDAKLNLTNKDLALYYWTGFYNMYNQYGMYASYMGLDPLHLDTAEFQEGQTWQEFFLEQALNSYAQQTAVYQRAKEEGFVLPEEQQKELEDVKTELGGMEDIDEQLHQVFGSAVTLDDYLRYVEINIWYSAYMQQIRDGITYTDADLDAYYEAHSEDYEQQGLEKADQPMVNVRHILITPADDEEASWTEAEARANTLYAAWQAGDATEDSFAALVEENTDDPGSKENGGLYENVYPGQMVEAFNDWCFDAARQPGDTAVVKTDYGYHIMYFVSQSEEIHWKTQVAEDYTIEKAFDAATAIAADYDFQVDLTKIALALPGQIAASAAEEPAASAAEEPAAAEAPEATAVETPEVSEGEMAPVQETNELPIA